jgi:outer membrane protein OmpA-like peptidoglycan-associated protein
MTLSLSFAQQRSGYGILAGYGINTHLVDFRSFPQYPNCCPQFSNGKGNAPIIGIFYDFPLTNTSSFSTRLTYNDYQGTLTTTEFVSLSGNIQGEYQHIVDASLQNIGIESYYQYSPYNQLYIELGLRYAVYAHPTFSQKELLINPSVGTFPNGSRSRNEFIDQSIPNYQSHSFGPVLGLSYQLPLNSLQTLFLLPELQVYYPLNDIVSQNDWHIHQYRCGFSIRYSPFHDKDIHKTYKDITLIDTITISVKPPFTEFIRGNSSLSIDTIISPDSIVYVTMHKRTDTIKYGHKKQLEASITAWAVYDNNREEPLIKIVDEEFTSVLMTPLLPYVFFEKGSASIPNRYQILEQQQLLAFSEDSVNSDDRLSTYYHIMNIIAKRMKLYPQASLTLTGCNADIDEEQDNISLSKQRVESIKQYLINQCGIESTRLKLVYRNLPEKAANSKTKDGAQENRRVELIGSIPEINAPIITNETIRTINPPIVRFKSQVIHDNPLEKWNIISRITDSSSQVYKGEDNVPAILEWNIDKQKGKTPFKQNKLDYSLMVDDIEGLSSVDKGSIPVEYLSIKKKKTERIADKEINRFNLILFDVRSSDINSINKPIIQLIKTYIKPNSSVTVKGFTDKHGDTKKNEKLADERSKSTAKALGFSESSGSVYSQGNADMYSPEYPEGRLYTRTVDVIIETPIVNE